MERISALTFFSVARACTWLTFAHADLGFDLDLGFARALRGLGPPVPQENTTANIVRAFFLLLLLFYMATAMGSF